MFKYLTPAFTSIGVFIFCMAIFFAEQRTLMDQVILSICLVYALVCLLFLLFQLYAFFKAHSEYDPGVESVKYEVFRAEGLTISENNSEII